MVVLVKAMLWRPNNIYNKKDIVMSFKGINLGLEFLEKPATHDVCIDLIDFYDACADVQEAAHELGRMIYVYTNLDNITRCIKKYGVTKSLEVLYADNFSSSFAMEAEANEAKQNIIQRIIAWFKQLLQKIANWWMKVRDLSNKAKSSLDKATFTKPFKFNGTDLYEKREKSDPQKIVEISINTAEDFSKYKAFYNEDIRTLEIAQAALKGDINKTIEQLKQNKDDSLKERKAEYEKNLLHVTTAARHTINSMLNMSKAAEKAAKGKGDDASGESFFTSVYTNESKKKDDDLELDVDAELDADDDKKSEDKDSEDDKPEEDEDTSKGKKDKKSDDDEEESEEDDKDAEDEDDKDKKKSKKDDDEDDDKSEDEEESEDDVEEDDDKKSGKKSSKKKDKDEDKDDEDSESEDEEDADEEDEDKDDKKSKKDEDVKDFLDLF